MESKPGKRIAKSLTAHRSLKMNGYIITKFNVTPQKDSRTGISKYRSTAAYIVSVHSKYNEYSCIAYGCLGFSYPERLVETKDLP